MKFLAGLFQPFLIAAVHHKHQSGCVSIVMPPVWPHLLLTPHIPHRQAWVAPVRIQSFHVKTHCWHGHHTLVVLQLVKQGGLSRAIQTQQQDLCLFLRLRSMHTHIPTVQSKYPSLGSMCTVFSVALVCLVSSEECVVCMPYVYTERVSPPPTVVMEFICPCVAFSKAIYNQSDTATKFCACHEWVHITPALDHHTYQQTESPLFCSITVFLPDWM